MAKKNLKSKIVPLEEFKIRGFSRVQLVEDGRIVGDSGWTGPNAVVNLGFRDYLVDLIADYIRGSPDLISSPPDLRVKIEVLTIPVCHARIVRLEVKPRLLNLTKYVQLDKHTPHARTPTRSLMQLERATFVIQGDGGMEVWVFFRLKRRGGIQTGLPCASTKEIDA